MLITRTSQDLIIYGGILAAIGLAIIAAVMARLVIVRVGLLFSAAMVCVGWANSEGLIIGGITLSSARFGITLVCLGLATATVLGAIEEAVRRLTRPLDDRRPGFPVAMKRTGEESATD